MEGIPAANRDFLRGWVTRVLSHLAFFRLRNPQAELSSAPRWPGESTGYHRLWQLATQVVGSDPGWLLLQAAERTRPVILVQCISLGSSDPGQDPEMYIFKYMKFFFLMTRVQNHMLEP